MFAESEGAICPEAGFSDGVVWLVGAGAAEAGGAEGSRWMEVESVDRSAVPSAASGARVSVSVFRGLLSMYSGLWSSTMIDADSGIQPVFVLKSCFGPTRAAPVWKLA